MKTRRRVIVLMLINLFALFINYFELSPSIKVSDETHYLLSDGRSNDDSEHFFPFTRFTAKGENGHLEENFLGMGEDIYIQTPYRQFKGIFPDYDISEFLVYTGLIIIVLLVRRFW